jgi:regulator of RNase E activity RraB
MAGELIVDFPTHQDRRSMRSVQFADTMEMHIVDRHGDNEDVDRRDLWYNESDYSRMRHAIQKSVLKVRAMDLTGVPISYSGDDGSSNDCLIGIEHLLTQACMFEVKACRRRCVRAVLQEQARQRMNPSASAAFKWDAIAAASFDETRKAAVRAWKLGKLHQDSM